VPLIAIRKRIVWRDIGTSTWQLGLNNKVELETADEANPRNEPITTTDKLKVAFICSSDSTYFMGMEVSLASSSSSLYIRTYV